MLAIFVITILRFNCFKLCTITCLSSQEKVWLSPPIPSFLHFHPLVYGLLTLLHKKNKLPASPPCPLQPPSSLICNKPLVFAFLFGILTPHMVTTLLIFHHPLLPPPPPPSISLTFQAPPHTTMALSRHFRTIKKVDNTVSLHHWFNPILGDYFTPSTNLKELSRTGTSTKAKLDMFYYNRPEQLMRPTFIRQTLMESRHLVTISLKASRGTSFQSLLKGPSLFSVGTEGYLDYSRWK